MTLVAGETAENPRETRTSLKKRQAWPAAAARGITEMVNSAHDVRRSFSPMTGKKTPRLFLFSHYGPNKRTMLPDDSVSFPVVSCQPN